MHGRYGGSRLASMQTTARMTTTPGTPPAARLVVRRGEVEERKARAGIRTDEELARMAGLHPTQISRVLSGHCDPGTKFVAGILYVFGPDAFEALFDVVDDNADAA
ncbi:HTH DNA binding protein [Mycobacterium phage Mendokysei]|uniref:Helix-turn-helix DNA binding protein n=1 Tax=Mycobacterium phage Mendokysei TaxID=2099637 RepID=A0A2P1CG69_9CAUD|nr:HTH DNA binding protein [Mycobacterium phage Mendokysei]AVJ50251.1 helix-turn-helix DNA binding protein [Mycobacterium phage Mendokysei]